MKLERELLIEPGSKPLIEEIAFERLDGKQKFSGTIVQIRQDVKWQEATAFQTDFQFNLNPKKLFGYLQQMKVSGLDYFEVLAATWDKGMMQSQKLRSASSAKPETAKKNKEASKAERKHCSPDKRNPGRGEKDYDEVDLHADALHLPVDRLGNFEILTLQLERLEKSLSLAARNGKTSLIIIHGVGKGKLKEEVQRLLAHHPLVSFYQSSWRPGYGNGATEAFLK